MFFILSCGIEVACGIFGPLVRFQFSICCSVTVVLSLSGVDGRSVAGVVPLGAVVMQPKPAGHSQRRGDHKPGQEAIERVDADHGFASAGMNSLASAARRFTSPSKTLPPAWTQSMNCPDAPM